jgi:hypothetical protein
MNFSLISKLIISNGLEDKDKYVDILTAYASQGGLCLLIRHALCSTQNSLAPLFSTYGARHDQPA